MGEDGPVNVCTHSRLEWNAGVLSRPALVGVIQTSLTSRPAVTPGAVAVLVSIVLGVVTMLPAVMEFAFKIRYVS